MAGKRTVQVLIAVNIALFVAQLFWMWIYGRDVNLLLACASDDIDKFTWALFLGANPNARTSNGTTALMIAAGSRNWVLAHDLIQHGADANLRDEEGETALFKATRVEDIVTVGFLLKHGADPNIPESEAGLTPLMIAARYGQVGIVKLLLAHGADPTIKDVRGLTALDFAHRQKGELQAKIAALIKQKLAEMGNR
ncbi:MAG: ankyrin repeat domain-containing protein [Armatimonadota bacterium]